MAYRRNKKAKRQSRRRGLLRKVCNNLLYAADRSYTVNLLASGWRPTDDEILRFVPRMYLGPFLRMLRRVSGGDAGSSPALRKVMSPAVAQQGLAGTDQLPEESAPIEFGPIFRFSYTTSDRRIY